MRSMTAILLAACRAFAVDAEAVLQPGGVPRKPLADARSIALYLCREEGYTQVDIAREFGMSAQRVHFNCARVAKDCRSRATRDKLYAVKRELPEI